MLTTKRKPISIGEILTEEFMQPAGLTQGALAKAMGVQRKHVRTVQRSQHSDGGNGAHPGARVRQFPRFRAECSTPHRSLRGVAQPARARAYRSGGTVEPGGLSREIR